MDMNKNCVPVYSSENQEHKEKPFPDNGINTADIFNLC
jgi:hypothetical protein